MKVRETVNLLDDNFNVITLSPGDTVPVWAEKHITNPDAIWTGPEAEETEVSGVGDSDGSGADADTVHPYSELKKPELQELLKSRGLPTSGNVDELRDRLVEADATAAAGDAVDLWSMDEAELKSYAAEKGIDVGEAANTAELAAVIAQATAE